MQDIIELVAASAKEISAIASVGGAETAGLIISVLAANPDLTAEFLQHGSAALLNGQLAWENGCLTWHGTDGQIKTPEVAFSAQERAV